MVTIIAHSVIYSVLDRGVNFLYTAIHLQRLDVKKKNTGNKYLNNLYWLYISPNYADMHDIQLCLLCYLNWLLNCTSYILSRNKLRIFNDIRIVDDNQLLLICGLVYYLLHLYICSSSTCVEYSLLQLVVLLQLLLLLLQLLYTAAG